jgi:signal transduction histidine kinase
LVTGLLATRTPKPPDLAAEVTAFHELAELMLEQPERAVQRFVDLALKLCDAGTVGLSVVAKAEDGAEIFRWDALAGRLASYVGGTTPRHFSPCGLCLDAGAPVLVARPGRVFNYFNQVEPAIIEALIVPLYDAGRIALATIWVVAHDDQHKFDAEHVRIMTQLAAQLVLALKIAEERKSGLGAQKDRAEELNRSKTRLLAAVGHDLRQPLTVIMGVLQMVAARQGDRDWKLLAHAEAATARLARAFDLMMEVGRLELGNVQPNVRPRTLRGLFDELRDEYRLEAERKGLAFRVVASDLTVLTDPDLLGSILHNLVGNVVKYTERGGVLVGCRRRANHALIQVWDTGRGIPADMLSLVFEEYQQLAPLSSTGTGLGLSIVKRTADLLGHSLDVHSTLGRGSCFTVEVPTTLNSTAANARLRHVG